MVVQGRMLGHSPGLWQRVAWLVLCPARAAGSKAKNAQDVALQTADPAEYQQSSNRQGMQDAEPGDIFMSVSSYPSCHNWTYLNPSPTFASTGHCSVASWVDLPGCKEAFRNERRPTNFDKKVLVWSGRFKKEEDIPRHISSDLLNTARNIVRIKVCYIMIALSVLGCVTMVVTGKEAAKKDQTLLRVNAEKKAKWKAEVKKGQEAAVGKSQ